MKKIAALLLAVLMILPLAPVAFAQVTGIEALKINPYGGAENDIDTVSWYDLTEKYLLVLPANTDLSEAKVYFTASSYVTLDGNVIACGGSASAFTKGNHVLSCGDTDYPLTVWISENVPSVHISTKSGSLDYIHQDKGNKEPGNIRVYENGTMTLDKELKQIKGRGNTTWTYPKKPYNIKFDKKTDMFGMGKAKKWTLLANYNDQALIHNVYGWELAKEFGLDYTSEYKHIDLYINGEYLGNYIICESVEVGENRVEIDDLEKANEKANPDLDIESLPRGGTGYLNTVQSYTVKGSRKWIEIPDNPADISGGYLLEYELGNRYYPELCGFVTQNGQPIVIKSPEYASKAQVNYIADFVDAGTEALYSETGFNSEGKHYSDYFDMESLVNMYILQEISMNYDAGLSSLYAYKPKGEGKIVFSPIWDMDNAFGCRKTTLNVMLSDTDLWWVNQMGINNIPTVLCAAERHADFRAAVRSRWAELRSEGVLENVKAKVSSIADEIKVSGALNGIRWSHFVSTDPGAVIRRWDVVKNVCLDFTEERTANLDRGFGDKGAYLYYDLNGAYSARWALVSEIREINDTITLREYTGNGTVNPPEGKVFYCWNTAADGSGEKYMPGDSFTLSTEENVFYAIWKTQEEIDDIILEEQIAPYKAEFEAAKPDALTAAGGKERADDSEAAKKLIADAKAEITNLEYDKNKTLEENLAAINEILASLDSDLSTLRNAYITFNAVKANAVKSADGKARAGDSAAAEKLIADAKNNIGALSYDETKTLVENLSAVNGILSVLDSELAALRQADKAVFETAKQNALDEVDGKAKQGDSAAAKKLLADAKEAIGSLDYDYDKTLAENLAEIDEILAPVDSELAALRQADKAAFDTAKENAVSTAGGKAKAGDGKAAKKLIADAKETIGNLDYDENKSLEENLAVIDEILVSLDSELASLRQADKAVFETIKANALDNADGKAKSGDSAASQKLITDAKNAIGRINYNENKTLEENIAVFDEILASLDSSLAAQREADEKANTPEEEKFEVCKWCGKIHTGRFGKFVAFLHSVFYFFNRIFGKK